MFTFLIQALAGVHSESFSKIKFIATFVGSKASCLLSERSALQLFLRFGNLKFERIEIETL